MRVIFLTHYYPPEVGAPQARISTLGRLLAERGVRVTIHTGFPNYPDGRVKPPYRVRPLMRERDGELRVVRCAVYPAANRGLGRRLLNHLSFAASAVATARRAGKADVVVAETPPLFCAAAGRAYAALAGAALVVNVADRWPASAVELGALRFRPAIRAAESLERACYRAATAITVPTDGLMVEIGRLSEASGKVRRLGPAVDTERFVPSPIPRRERLRVLYAGTIGMAQGVGTLLDAASILGPDRWEVWIAGDGAEAEEVRQRVARERLSHVRLLGSVPHSRVPELYSQVDAAVVLLRDRPLFEAALPTKTLEAMAAGRPIVVSARGELAGLIEDARAGIAVEPEQPEALARALADLADHRDRLPSLGEAARAQVERRFSWAATAGDWHDLLIRVAEAPQGVSPGAGSARSPASSSPRRAD